MNYPGASCEVVWLKQRKLLTVPRLTFILSSLIANISRYRFFVAFLANGIYEESFWPEFAALEQLFTKGTLWNISRAVMLSTIHAIFVGL